MSLYLDASVLIFPFRLRAHTESAAKIAAEASAAAIVSDLARAEFAAVMGWRYRTGALTSEAIQRAPDDLHIAMAKRLSAKLVTFDNHMAMSARALGLDVA